MALTDTAIRAAKGRDKPYRMYDERGLYLEVSPKGGRWWRFKYRFAGKEKRISLGTYPEISLADARDRREAARKQVANGVDPSAVRKAAKTAQIVAHANSFEAIALEWLEKKRDKWVEAHYERNKRRLEANIFPWLGNQPISEITAPELLVHLRRVEERGAVETAHRVRALCSQVFRYAIATVRCERDPAADLIGALKEPRQNHHASITDPEEIGQLMAAIDGYEGSYVTRCALKLAPLVFVRPGELRHAEWAEIDFEGAEWRIPAAKMKMRTPHIVPLATQAVEILRDLHPLTQRSTYCFPSVRSAKRPMSENTLNAALRRLGYTKDQMTAHGFRSMASTILNERGFKWDAIERQLAHAERSQVRAAYNYAEYLPERREMMQWWADHLDELRA